MNSNSREKLIFKDKIFLRQLESGGLNVQNKVSQKLLNDKVKPAELANICLNNITSLQEQLFLEEKKLQGLLKLYGLETLNSELL